MSGSCTPYAAKITHPSTVHDRFNGATTSPINMASEMDLHVWNGKVNARGNPLIGSRRSRSKLLKTHSGKFLSSEGRGDSFPGDVCVRRTDIKRVFIERFNTNIFRMRA
jgi:hypothetical protein